MLCHIWILKGYLYTKLLLARWYATALRNRVIRLAYIRRRTNLKLANIKSSVAFNIAVSLTASSDESPRRTTLTSVSSLSCKIFLLRQINYSKRSFFCFRSWRNEVGNDLLIQYLVHSYRRIAECQENCVWIFFMKMAQA